MLDSRGDHDVHDDCEVRDGLTTVLSVMFVCL